MSDLPTRRYSDAEVRLLLERAASLQGRPDSSAKQQGLTLAQLEEIAAEAQIDVTRLREAARELDAGGLRPAGLAARLAGAPLHVQVEHILPFEVSTDALGTLVDTITNATGRSGMYGLLGRTFTWTGKAHSGRKTDVRVTVGQGRTHIRVEERYGEVAGGMGGAVAGIGGGIGLGVGGAIAGAIGSAAFAVAFPLVVIGGTVAACRAGFRSWVSDRTKRLGLLCDRIAHDLTVQHDTAKTDAPDMLPLRSDDPR